MSEEKDMKKIHEGFAAGFFNNTWDLVDKKDKSDDDISLMINAAHASLYHWHQIGTPLHFLRGEWMVSYTYSLAGLGESALYHAKRCMDYIEKENIGDWDRFFGYEALARAYACSKNKEKAKEFYKKAMDSLDDVKDQGDKDHCLNSLKAEPWYGMDLA